jgi:hypothetical protein
LKNKLTITVFLIIPVFLFIISNSLKNSQGPYFTRGQYDPSYTYLISSLNLAQFSGVAHVDHPGTPVQVIGALVIRLVYFLDHKENSLAKEVLMNPEKYLDKINYTFLIIDCFGLFILGVISYKVYSSILISLLLQLTPFTSISILAHFTFVRPENFLAFVILIFISGLILFTNEKDLNAKKYLRYIIFFGIVSGLAIATKITFFPLAIIPFVLFRGIKFKLSYLAIVSVSFLFFVLPALSFENINYFAQWIYDLILHDKKYGRGESNFIDLYSFLHNIKSILFKEWFFDLAFFFVCLSLAMCLLPKFKILLSKSGKTHELDKNHKQEKFNNGFLGDSKCKLVLGFFLAMTIQIMIVAKHYGNNYMFPVLTLSVFAILISISILSTSFGMKLEKRSMNIIYLMLILLISVYGTQRFYAYKNYQESLTEESVKLLDYEKKNFNNPVVVSAIRVSNIEFAFFGSIYYAGPQKKNYESILDSIYPSTIIFYGNKCYTFNSDTAKIENTFKSADRIIFMCSNESYLQKFLELLKNEYGIVNTTVEKRFSNMDGEIYEIKLEH